MNTVMKRPAKPTNPLKRMEEEKHSPFLPPPPPHWQHPCDSPRAPWYSHKKPFYGTPSRRIRQVIKGPTRKEGKDA